MFTKKPVSGINDVKSLKIRTGGGVAEAVANAIGASAFVKPAPESYELLNSGVADGVFFPFESIVSFKLESVIGQGSNFLFTLPAMEADVPATFVEPGSDRAVTLARASTTASSTSPATCGITSRAWPSG